MTTSFGSLRQDARTSERIGTIATNLPRAMTPFVLALGLLALAARASADTYPRQRGVDVVHYTFRLTLNDDTDEVVGEAVADLRLVEAGLSEVALDLASALDGKGMTVTEVRSGDSPAHYTHEANRLRIVLDPPAQAGERRRITVRYRGVPASGLRIGKNRYGERTFTSDNWPDKVHQWLPVIDHPYDKATSEFVVTAPAHYQVVSNGLLVEEFDLDGKMRQTHWRQTVPIASWLNALGVARFAAHHAGSMRGVPLEAWLYPQDREAGQKSFEPPARQAFEFFSERVGPYPYEKLACVEAAGVHGGMELATAVFLDERAANGRPATELVAHEVAHQWFGDSVTESDWDDVWLSEGFATYFTLLFFEHTSGRDAFVAGLKRARVTALAAEKRLRSVCVVHDNLNDTRTILSPLVYQKAGWFLHMLRGQVGDEAFWTGIRAYYAQYRDRNATTDDFRRVMEEAASADLKWLFEQWLHRPQSPVIEGSWRYDAEEKRVVVELAQTQPGEPYRLPLEVGISREGDTRVRFSRIEMTQMRQTFSIAAESEPASVALDPNTWVLMDARFTKKGE